MEMETRLVVARSEGGCTAGSKGDTQDPCGAKKALYRDLPSVGNGMLRCTFARCFHRGSRAKGTQGLFLFLTTACGSKVMSK